MRRTVCTLSLLAVGVAWPPLLFSDLSASASQAQEGAAAIEADEMEYRNNESQVVAKGNVEITYEERVLQADEVIYHQAENRIEGEGNIRLEDTNGDVYFAKRASINDTLTEGVIEELSGRFAGGSLFSANRAIRENEDRAVLEGARFSPCAVCINGEKSQPLWQLSAEKVTLDREKARMSYRHASLDLFGVPVLYTPYLSHPTPEAERATGLLAPTYSSDGNLGIVVSTPAYLNLAPNADVTLTPVFTSKEGTILNGEVRHLTRYGAYSFKGSITNPRERDINGIRQDGRDLRGHIEGQGHFDFENDWSAGFAAIRSSDDTYLQRYNINDDDLLTSRAYVQQLTERYFVHAQTLSFQGLNATDDPGATPFVLPLVEAEYRMPTGWMDSVLVAEGNLMALSKTDAEKSRRISGTLGWELPYTTQNGHQFKVRTSVRGDVYSVEDIPLPGNEKDGWIGRVIPQAELEWRYPLIRQGKFATVLIEPIVQVIASASGNNPDKIPNEDSLLLEITDLNLFSDNHFTGLDRVESGFRTNYGFEGSIMHEIANVQFLFGQHYHAKQDSIYTANSGMEDHFSDYVGRVSLHHNTKDAHLLYRFRIDKDYGDFRRQEVEASYGIDPVTFELGYLQLDEENSTYDRHEIASGATVRLNDTWSVYANSRRNLESGGGWVSAAGGVIYEGSCLKVGAGWKRDFTRDRDIEPSTTYLLTLSLKHLGSQSD